MTQSVEDSFPTHPREIPSPASASHAAPHTAPNQPGVRSEHGTHIQLAVPHNGNLAAGVLTSVMGASKRGIRPNITMPIRSWHCWNFNAAWCTALNSNPRPEYFIMHHADVMAEPGWMDKLLDIIRDTDADVISCNIAIKDDSEELSTAVFHTNPDGTHRIQRLRNDEVSQLPETFTMNMVDVKFPQKYGGGKLLLNTGLWICKFKNAKIVDIGMPDGQKLRGPWIEYFYFRMTDVIVRNGNKFEPQGMSEDWQAGLDWDAMGLDYRATSAIKINHFGNGVWTTGGK